MITKIRLFLFTFVALMTAFTGVAAAQTPEQTAVTDQFQGLFDSIISLVTTFGIPLIITAMGIYLAIMIGKRGAKKATSAF